MKEEETTSQEEQYYQKDKDGNIVPVSLDEIKHKNHLHHFSHHHSSEATPANDPERVAQIKTVAEAEAEREQGKAEGEHHHHHHHHHHHYEENVGIMPDNPNKDYTSHHSHHHHHHHDSVGIEPANPSRLKKHRHRDSTGEFRKAMSSHLTRKKFILKWSFRFLLFITLLVVCAVIAVYWFDLGN